MIERARRVLPGMVMTLLLSSPALAATSHDAKASHGKPDHRKDATAHAPTSTARAKTERAEHRVAESRPAKVAPSARHEAERREPVRKAVVASRVRTLGRAKLRETMPSVSQENNGRVIRRARLSEGDARVGEGNTGEVRGALIDDGTLWRESGNVATWQQTGVASWYGGKHWQGHRTSSGARYDENALTAAHATLPLGTKVRVVRNDGRSVIVTINDRPGTRTRIIDLSREAARALGILDTGVAMVTLQPM